MFFFAAALPSWAAAPDLIVNRQKVVRTIVIETRDFAAEDCVVVEGCVGGSGARKLLLFDVGIANIGDADFVIGNPNRRPGLFRFSECHGHLHLQNFASYALLKLNGQAVVRKRKQGFCLRDYRRYFSWAGPSRYTCDFQGITKGWQDIYDRSLDCQWLDITGVPPGRYLLRITANPQRTFPESNYANNSVSVPVTVRE